MTIKDNNEIRNLFVNKKYKEIIDISSIKGNFDDALSINILSLSYLNIGNYEKSISILKEAISKYGEDISLLNNLGNAYNDYGKVDKAIDGYRKAISYNPNYAKAFLNLAKTQPTLQRISSLIEKGISIRN